MGLKQSKNKNPTKLNLFDLVSENYYLAQY